LEVGRILGIFYVLEILKTRFGGWEDFGDFLRLGDFENSIWRFDWVIPVWDKKLF